MQRYTLKRFWMMKEADDGAWVLHADYEKLQKELTYTEERLARSKESEGHLWKHIAWLKKRLNFAESVTYIYRDIHTWEFTVRKHLNRRVSVLLRVTLLGWSVIVLLLILFSLGVL